MGWRARTKGFAAVFTLAVAAAISSAPPASSGASGADQPAVTVLRELPALRTATSDTFLQSDGTRLAKVHAEPVNFKTSTGEWQPIDDTLIHDDAGWHPKASSAQVSLPTGLSSGPVSISTNGQRVAFALQEAGGGDGVASGPQVSYANVRSGVNVSYRVLPTHAQETLSLADRSDPSTYRYKLTYSAGIHPELTEAGGVAFTNGAGAVVYAIAPPSARDSGSAAPTSVPVRYVLSEEGSILTLVIDKAWLQESSRTYPVIIDPDLYYGAQQACTLASNETKTGICSGPLYVGKTAGKKGVTYRSLLQFDLSCIPRDSVVINSNLGLYLHSDTSATPLEVDANALTHSFTEQATWTNYDGKHAWGTAGGDFSTTTAGTQTVLDAWRNGWVSWGFTPLVQKWVNEPSANLGVILKAHTASTETVDEFAHTPSESSGGPTMNITYTPRLGSEEGDVLLGEELANGGEVAVNAASGNLFVTSPDVGYEGEGYETKLTRYYNSMDEDMTGDSFGGGWVLSSGENALLYPSWWDRTDAFHLPGGAWERFTPEPPASSSADPRSLTYKAAPDATQTLTQHENWTRTVKFAETGVEWRFDSSENGFPQAIVEPAGAGNTISLSYTASRLTRFADTHGHTLTLTRESGTTHATKIESTSGEVWKYGYNANHQLTSYVSPTGAETHYGYNAYTLLDEIKDASGTYIITYNTSGRVASLRKVINGTPTEPGSEDEIASYQYKAPESPTCNPVTDAFETTVTYSPGGTSASYCFDASDHFTGPNTEAQEEREAEPEETWVTPPEIKAGTCTEAEVFKDCELHEAPSEEETDLTKEEYGIADDNWILPHTHTKAEEEKGEIHEPFDYLTESPFQKLGPTTTPGVMRVRRTIPWNMALEAKYDDEKPGWNHGAKIEREDVESWIEQVKAWGGGKGEPIISFKRCPQGAPWADPTKPVVENTRSCEEPPSWQAYQDAMKVFFERPKLAEVKSFTAWNEPNYKGEPTEKTPKLAGQYWRVLDDICVEKPKNVPASPECRVAAGEFSDIYMANAEHSKYFWEYVEGTGRPTTLNRWAWHSYKDGVSTQKPGEANNTAAWWGRFKRFKGAIDHAMRNSSCVPCRTPNIWLTEQGVTFFEHKEAKTVTIPGRKQASVIWTAKKIAENIMRAYVASKNHLSIQKQVTRFFYYSMRGNPNFDSGLLEPVTLLSPYQRRPGLAASQPREIYRIYQAKTLYGDH